MEDLNAQPLLKTKRQQVSRACSNCRKAKTACSNHRPCQRCVKFNLQSSCEDAPRKQRANTDKKPKSPRSRNASTSPNMLSGQHDEMEMDESPSSEELNIAEIQYQQFMQPYQAPLYHTGPFLQSFQSQPANQGFNNFLPQYSPPFVPPQQQQQQFPFAPPFSQPPFQQNQFQQPQQQAQPHQQNQFQTYPFNQQNNNHNNNNDINIQPNNALNQLQQTTFNIATSAMNSNESFQEPSSKSAYTYTYPNPEECSLDKLQSVGGSSGNLSFGSSGSLTELMKMRTPSLESLIVTVNSEITKKNKKEDSFSSIPI